jgi:hypothetical protein
MTMLLKSYGLLAKEGDTLFYYSPCAFLLKVFMSSLRSVDIIPLRGTGAKRSSAQPIGAKLGVAVAI